jgi:hypothetical protein
MDVSQQDPFFPTLDDGKIDEKWSIDVLAGCASSLSLSTLDIESRVVLIDDWCRVGDLGFIFAARGLGKTWLAMHLAHGLATNKDVGPWKIHQPCKVLYVDGEMAAADIKFRDNALGFPVESLVYLNHEILFNRTTRIMNLADIGFQRTLITLCEKQNFQLLFLDNLSTLASGIDENKTIDWEIIQPWLLKLRRANVTVIFIHHAGRNNQMRGASKREDPASWVLRLDAPNDADEHAGAHFISRFTKWRGAKRQPKAYEWTYSPELNGEVFIDIKDSAPMTVFRHHIENGLDVCSVIAEEMGVTAGYISQLATRAEMQGWLTKRGRRYVITEEE